MSRDAGEDWPGCRPWLECDSREYVRGEWVVCSHYPGGAHEVKSGLHDGDGYPRFSSDGEVRVFGRLPDWRAPVVRKVGRKKLNPVAEGSSDEWSA